MNGPSHIIGGLLVVLLFSEASLAVVPPNDDCADAIQVEVGSYAGTTSGATNDHPGSCGASSMSPDVWYSFTATDMTGLTVDTCASSQYDTVLSLHLDCDQSEIVCNDDTCGLQSSVATVLEPGETVLIRVSGYSGASGDFDLAVTLSDPPEGPADVVLSNSTSVSNWGVVDGVRGYSIGSFTCNIGGDNLLWGGSHNGTPVLGMNGYRLEDGRLMQIGMSWAKHGTGAAAGNGCGLPCNGEGGSVLGVGCLDVYSSGFNGSYGILGPRSDVNAWTGELLQAPSGSGDAIYRRLQIPEADLTGAGALYFIEGVYVGLDDAGVFGNAYNNASYKRITLGAGFDLNPVGDMSIGIPAIHAWRDHGLGIDVPDPSVDIQEVDIPGEGRFVVATKVVDNRDGTWRYEYAIFNLNSDRSAGSFTVPVPAGAVVSDIGFHDVDYHSGEIYDPTDWIGAEGTSAVAWASTQTHAENPNANALRWGTMYNFWMTVDAPPASGAVEIGLFKPGSPAGVSFVTSIPAVACPADTNGDDAVDVTDLLTVLGAWGTPGGDVTGDGETNVEDLLAVLAAWGPCS